MSLEKKIYWGVGVLSAALLVHAFLTPADRPEASDLPWHISHPTPDTTQVFGLTLGQSSASDAQQRFKEKAELALFRSTDGILSGEAFFEQINLAGLRSKVVLTLDLSQEELRAMHDRGLRMTATGGSGKKIDLAPDDAARLINAPIGSLTLIPGVKADDAILQKRFGNPSHSVKDPGGVVTHYLYAQHALSISSSTVRSEKQVFQYVAPPHFNRLLDPLLKSGGTVTSPS